MPCITAGCVSRAEGGGDNFLRNNGPSASSCERPWSHACTRRARVRPCSLDAVRRTGLWPGWTTRGNPASPSLATVRRPLRTSMAPESRGRGFRPRRAKERRAGNAGRARTRYDERGMSPPFELRHLARPGRACGACGGGEGRTCRNLHISAPQPPRCVLKCGQGSEKGGAVADARASRPYASGDEGGAEGEISQYTAREVILSISHGTSIKRKEKKNTKKIIFFFLKKKR